MIATMLRGSTGLSRWLLLAGLLCYSSCQSVPSSFENKTGQNESRPRVFSPRMDYDEWTPLGRGDPLKNNPTFDYVPPVLDRVQYWLDSHTTEPSAKRDILVLGVTAKKTSPKIPEQFLKFVDGPKFTRTSQDTSYRNDFTGSTGAELPKVVRTTSFRNGPMDYRNQDRIQSMPVSYYPSPYYNQKTKPYTMMLPPPLVQKPVAEPSTTFSGGVSKDKIVGYVEPTQQFSTQTEEGPVLQDSQYYGLPSKNYNQHPSPSSPSRGHPQNSSKSPNKGHMVSQIETIKSVYTPPSQQSTKSRYETTTIPSVSFEKSNLIYQSTQTLSGGWLGNNGATSTIPDASQPTWQTPDYSRDQYEIDHHAAASSNHEVVVGQNANIIVDGDSNENEEVVVGQKETVSPDKPSTTSVNVVQPSSLPTDGVKENDEEASTNGQSSQKMHIVVANSPSSNLDVDAQKAKKGPVAVVMPTNYVDKKWNLTSQNLDVAAPILSVSENSMLDNEKSSQKIQLKPQVPIFVEEPPSPPALPNRMMPNHHQLNHPQPPSVPPPPRHPGSSNHMFGPPQTPLQSLMHSQSRPNHAMMHFIGSMRPGIGFRPPGSLPVSHVSPPMTHMHAPPLKSMMSHMGVPMIMDQPHQRPQMQPFSFTSPPAPSTLTLQAMGVEEHTFDRHRSRAPDMTTLITTPTPFVPTASSTENVVPVSSTENQDRTKIDQSPLVKVLNENEEEESRKRTTSSVSRPSTTTVPQTTTVPSLTTDPIFSHYKQPAKPIRGPMYIIIQGHSKVKTYKPTVNKHGVPVEKNEIAESATEKQLSKFEQFIKENTKGVQQSAVEKKKQLEEKAKAEKLVQSRQSDSLMSLVESGLGSFTVSPSSSSATEEEHQANSVTTIEINGN